MEASQKPKLPKFTRVSIELCYLFGATLGALGCLTVWLHLNQEAYWWGSSLIISALAIKIASHGALASNYSNYFYLLGQILATLVALLIIFLIPWPPSYRAVLALALSGLAFSLYRGFPLAQKIWQILTIIMGVIFAIIFLRVMFTIPFQDQLIPLIYLSLSLFYAFFRRWLRQGDLQLVSVPKKAVPDIKELWRRGRLEEIFGLSANHTKLELAEKYGKKLREFNGRQKLVTIMNEAFAILQVNETAELYKKSRQIMESIRKKVGGKKFLKAEAKLWGEIWTEVERIYNFNPELMTAAAQQGLCDKYARKI